MAQNISLLGASYSAVPAVKLPKTGGGTATFTDVTDTTAAAADVASGKYFYDANGVKTQGTASGGGSATLKFGAIRPDAAAWKTYSFDKKLVSDMSKTIPSYSTSAQTIQASDTIATVTLDFTNYNYFILTRCFTYPIYSASTKGKGKFDFTIASAINEVAENPDAQFHSLVDGSSYTVGRSLVTTNTYVRCFYWSGSNTKTSAFNSSYGTYQTVPTHSLSSSTLTIKSPALMMRGSTTYLTSTYWGTITDVRYQYVIEVYRAEKGNLNIDGWMHTSQTAHMADCINGNDHKLT